MIALFFWLLLVGFMLIIFSIGIPLRFDALINPVKASDYPIFPGLSPSLSAVSTSRIDEGEAEALQTIGISRWLYAMYILAFDIALAGCCTLIGFLIFWRKNGDWQALWVSFFLVALGTQGASMVVPSMATVWPGWILVSLFFGSLGMTGNVHLLFNSPDGNYVPIGTKGIALIFTGLMLGVVLYSIYIYFQKAEVWLAFLFLLLVFPIWLLICALGVLSQVYRYIKVSDQVQRQQAKWVAAGLIPVTFGFMANGFLLFAASSNSGMERVVFYLVRAPVVNLCLAFLPICIGISILRYRLWDIDLVIRRTLVYSLLTGLLSLIYFGGVALLQGSLSTVGSRSSPAVIVVTTLVIAALFNPLRRRIQDFIDRRFYRQKYDAEYALSQFAAAAQSPTDLEQLSSQLIVTVHHILQPEHISLTLINTQGNASLGDPS
jgi:hypothetical protein